MSDAPQEPTQKFQSDRPVDTQSERTRDLLKHWNAQRAAELSDNPLLVSRDILSVYDTERDGFSDDEKRIQLEGFQDAAPPGWLLQEPKPTQRDFSALTPSLDRLITVFLIITVVLLLAIASA